MAKKNQPKHWKDLSKADALGILAATAPGVTAVEMESDLQLARKVAAEAAEAAHPDRHGGDRTAWEHIERARTALSVALGMIV